VRTYNADGSYTDTTTYASSSQFTPAPSPPVATIVENSDGSGTYSVPFFGGSNTTLTFSTPSPGGVITVGGFSNGSRTASVWYPLPLHLYTETDKNFGSVAIPAACNAAPGFGSNANALSLSTQRVDTILGTIETLSQTTYVIPTYGARLVLRFQRWRAAHRDLEHPRRDADRRHHARAPERDDPLARTRRPGCRHDRMADR